MGAKDEKKKRIFEKMLMDMHTMADEGTLLDTCMDLDAEAMRKIPLRYRIIALGFVKHMTLAEVQDKLSENGCPRLYSRSFREAMLIVAFQNQLTYEQWQELCRQCGDLIRHEDRYFSDKKITYAELERYVTENSEHWTSQLRTEQQTRLIESELVNAGSDIERLRAVLQSNAGVFSDVREKTRYYFCKYLYFWLNRRIEAYFDACRRNSKIDLALSDLLCLKVVTVLRKNKTMSESEKRRLIRESAISCGALFDEFNYFYFEYASLDWMEILLEVYESISQIPSNLKSALAANFKKSDRALKRMSDDDVILKHIEDEENEADAAGSKINQRGRAGENAVKKFIKGTLDIDRTVLICFLLFFAGDASLQRNERIKPDRINQILLNCGYPGLNIEDDFDWFAVEFLDASNPMKLLEDVVVEMAQKQENSFLYHLYAGATSFSAEIDELAD